MLLTLGYLACAWIAAVSLTRVLNPSSVLAERTLTTTVCFIAAYILPVHLIGVVELLGVGEPLRLEYLLPPAAVVASVLFWLARRSPASPRPVATATQYPFALRVAASVLAASYALALVNMLDAYPTGFDAEYYRWPLALRWLQEHSLKLGPAENWRAALPANGEIGVFLVLSGGFEKLLPIAQWPATLALGLSVYLMSVRFVACRTTAILTVLMTLSIPIVYFQTFSGYVDLLGTSMLVAAAALALMATGYSTLFTAALAAGIALGTKPIFWPYAAAWAVLAIVIFFRSGAEPRRRLMAGCSILLAGMLLPSAFWFARAASTTGNPLYPLQVTIAGQELLAGSPAESITPEHWAIGRFVDTPTGWLVYPWTEFKKTTSATTYSEDSGLGALFATFVPLGLVFALWTAITRPRDESYWVRTSLGLFCLLALVWWFAFQQLPRFGLPLIVLSILLTAPMLKRLLSEQRGFLPLFCVATIATSALLAFDPLVRLGTRTHFSRSTRSEQYAVPAFLDTLPPGTVVLNLSPTQNYRLAGASLSNEIIFDFEAPSPLTHEFVERNGIEYILTVGAEKRLSAPLSGLTAAHDTRIEDPITGAVLHWSLWTPDSRSQGPAVPLN